MGPGSELENIKENLFTAESSASRPDGPGSEQDSERNVWTVSRDQESQRPQENLSVK